MPKTINTAVQESLHKINPEVKQKTVAYQAVETYNDSPINAVMPGGYCTVEEKSIQGNKLFATVSPSKSINDPQEKLSTTMCNKLSESIKELMRNIEERCEKIESKIDKIVTNEVIMM